MHVAPRQIRTEPRPICLLCGHTGKTLHERLADYMFNAPGEWTFKQCPNPECGLCWVDPFPLPEDLHLAYQSYYTHDKIPGANQARGGLREFLYQTYCWASAIPSSLVGLQTERNRLAWMHLQALPKGRALDVGCGDGNFLNRIRKAGWESEGVEFDEKAIARAK